MEDATYRRGFQEIPHTADWAMKAWAEDLPALFAEAAKGMNSLAGVRLVNGPQVKRQFKAQAADNESLLVAFLSELVYLQEQENMGFTDFVVTIDGPRLVIEMLGAHLAALDKPIKAVTYHGMKIERTQSGFQVEIVFDV